MLGAQMASPLPNLKAPPPFHNEGKQGTPTTYGTLGCRGVPVQDNVGDV